MIYTYGITLQGTYHIKNNIVCQDNHKIVKCNDTMVVAAVADGLGSEDHTDVASKLAVHCSTEYCKKHLSQESRSEEIVATIKDSFKTAQQGIEKTWKMLGHNFDQYDTTLSLAILINDTLYYGHSGDSGIVALTTDGLYEKVTEQQRDEEGRVFPLFENENKWIFGQFEKKVCSVFLATDGIYEILFPYMIRKEIVNIHVNLARFFMDNQRIMIDKEGEIVVRTRIHDFMMNIPDEQVNDDKTVVVLVNTSVNSKLQPEEYYKEPDWADLKRKHDDEYRRQAYPHLLMNKKGDKPESVTLDNKTEEKENNVSMEVFENYSEYTVKEEKEKPKSKVVKTDKKGFLSLLRLSRKEK